MKIQFQIIALLSVISGNLGAGEPTCKEVVTPVAVEECLSYDFIDLDYGVSDYDNDFYGGGDAYGIGFSKSLGDLFYLTGGYSQAGYDFNTAAVGVIGVDRDRFRGGLGVHFDLSECVHLTLEGGADHFDASYDNNANLDYDSWAYYAGPGIRGRWGRFEAFANAYFTGREGDLSQQYLTALGADALGVDEDGWVFNAGLIFHVTDHFGLKLAGEAGELDNAVTAGVRFEF